MKVTRPIFPRSASAFKTSRLLIRPKTEADATEFHILRTQPEVMIFTSAGVVDRDLDATRTWVNRFIHPNNATTFSFAVEELASPGVIIGTVGVHMSEPPTLGYLFRKEYWGKGYATESVIGWLEQYWKLPRRELDLQDEMPEKRRVPQSAGAVREVLTAEVEASNTGSIKVMKKSGFLPTGTQEEVEDFRGPAVLVHYYIARPEPIKD
ncbi:uncharacterized protein HMPREF1541_01217 [Cyphellophora europaea CBS 101466]|uniref:N-acetyltransferase domain-containing protein n=1 Tax=Cyphellophora europaea (strain CBS 101466) TaxID=1220924 RepID=W2SEB0_CYPE1|nr:uncharacterized protein HMPREF1541_01217 [Cyphellophora europaea CBS 101466]ETN47027.1 hypothetical protein HMPREF1541_01217 [Cyphellophora europaea CBS 101466]